MQFSTLPSSATTRIGLSVPSFTATGTSQSQVSLAWDSVPGAAGYFVAEKVNGIQIELDRRNRELKAIELRLADIARERGPRRRAQAERIRALRQRRRGMPAHWLDAAELALFGWQEERLGLNPNYTAWWVEPKK